MRDDLWRSAVFVLCLALVNCGGGGSDETSSSEALRQTGIEANLQGSDSQIGQALRASIRVAGPVDGAGQAPNTTGRTESRREPSGSGSGSGSGSPVFGGGSGGSSGGTGGTGSTGGSGTTGTIGASPGELPVYNGWTQSLKLFHAETIRPMFSTTASLRTQCRIVSGSLPEGFSLQPDCAISGRSQKTSNSSTLTIEGRTGPTEPVRTVTFSLGVPGPSLQYAGGTFGIVAGALGNPVLAQPNLGGWSVPTDYALTVNYRITSGQLPTGVTMNASTGTISGVLSALGDFWATIELSVSDGRQTIRLTDTVHAWVTIDPIGNWSYVAAEAGGDVAQAYVGVPYRAVPRVRISANSVGNVSLVSGTLPPGLTLTPGAGEVAGVPTTAMDTVSSGGAVIKGTVMTPEGLSATSNAVLAMKVTLPVEVGYGNPPSWYGIGKIVSISPGVGSRVYPPVAASISYAIRDLDPTTGSTCDLANVGLVFSPTTGIVSGTTKRAGMLNCVVTYTITVNGITWTGVTGLTFSVAAFF